MATRKTPAEMPDNDAVDDDDVSFSSSPTDKPKTAQELYRARVENGFIGAWKDRTDIGDSVEYARSLRKRASERLRGQ